MSETNWTYDREHGEVLDGHNRPVLYVSASRMDFDDVEGRRGGATTIGLLAAAAPDLAEALERAANMLSAVAGDIEDGLSPGDLRSKYVTVLVAARDNARAALARAKGAS